MGLLFYFHSVTEVYDLLCPSQRAAFALQSIHLSPKCLSLCGA
jgi:hypothetical protein